MGSIPPVTHLAIVGIDGATFEQIRPLVAAGELPHIARVLREGVSGILESETPPITPPAWTSMMTGVNPGRHGVFHFIRRQVGSYHCPLNDSRNYAGKDIHALLARRGWTVGSLGVPMCFPPSRYPGSWMVAGIPCPLEAELVCEPRELAGELRELLGHAYRPDVDYAPWDGDTEGPEDDLDRYESLRQALFAVERDRLEVLRHQIHAHPSDFLFAVVSITDRCQHYFWKFQDRSHAGWSAEGERRFGEVIRDAYRLADEFVGLVREEVGEEVPLALVSDHGFGPQNWDFHINRWLEEQGLLCRRPVPYWTWARAPLGAVLARLHLGPLARLLGPLARVPLLRPKRKRRPDLADVDWSRTRVHCQLHGLCLNLIGREAEGAVDPAEAEDLLADLERRLARLRLPDGRPAVDYTVRASEAYHGPRAVEAPDLQFQMAGLSCLPKDDWGAAELFTERRNAAISGTHRFPGIFALSGPGMAAGRCLEGMHIRDTTPTLLHAIGQPVPSWMEGAVREEVLDPPRPVERDPEAEPMGGEDAPGAYSAEQEAAIAESLKGLGYLQ